MNTISVQRGPRPSNQSCGLPSIWISSPNRGRRSAIETPLVTPLRLPSAKPNLEPSIVLRRGNPFKLRQLLAGQRRTKITILAAEQFARPFADARREPTVRGPPALARHKPCVTLGPIGPNKPLDLPNANPKPIRRRALADNLAPTCAITTSLSRSRPLIANAPEAINAPAQSRGDIPNLPKGTSCLH